eukprot:SAG31_NODE_1103_length_9895_cov_13.722540_7_plen_90_part_00
MRNNPQVGPAMTGDDLLRRGLIESTGTLDQPLPPGLAGYAAVHAEHGLPERVVRIVVANANSQCAVGHRTAASASLHLHLATLTLSLLH